MAWQLASFRVSDTEECTEEVTLTFYVLISEAMGSHFHFYHIFLAKRITKYLGEEQFGSTF